MPGITLEQLENFAHSNAGQLLAQGGEAIVNGADPGQVAAGLAASFAAAAPEGTTAGDFMASQAGALVSQFVANVAATGDVEGSLVGAAPAAVTLGLTVGLGAIGVLPPLSTLIAGAVAGPIIEFITGLFPGPTPTNWDNIPTGDHWQARARAYSKWTLPQAFYDFGKAQGYALGGAVMATVQVNGQSYPPTTAPPWPGLSMALAQWLLTNTHPGWGNYILLPGRNGGTGNQVGISYSLPVTVGDGWGWGVPGSGWWWYPALPANSPALGSLAEGVDPGPDVLTGPIAASYREAGIDIGKTYAKVLSTGSAIVDNIVLSPKGYAFTADQLETAVTRKATKKVLSSGQKQMLSAIGDGERGKRAALAALAALALKAAI